MHVCTYICILKLEKAIQSSKFRSEIHKAGLNILYTAWSLKSITNREIKNFGITQEQYNVLRILNGKHPEQMCVKDIASRMIEKSSNVPRIIDRLVLKKLVKRTDSHIDKRHTVMSLTEHGISTLILATERVNKLMDQVMIIDNNEAVLLNTILDKIGTPDN